MLASYKEKKYLIISLIIILLDGIIIYFVPSYFNKINYLYPMLTVSLIPFLYHNNLKKYYQLIIIIGLLYDLLYTNLFLYNPIIFLLIAKIDNKILNYFKESLFLFIIIIILNIVIYDTINFFIIFITNYQNVTLSDLFYKISHSLILNIMSGFVYYFLFKIKKLYT